MLATDGTWLEADVADDDWRWAIAPALVTSVVVLLVLALYLFARRVSGALDTPLAPIPLAVTAFVLVAWASALRLRLGDRHIDWLAAAVLALVAIACSFPADRGVDWLVWLSAFAVFGLMASIPAARCSPVTTRQWPPEQVVQQLTRSRTADGVETIHGTITADFAPGERTAVLHVAFCPPFERLPTVEAEADDCDVKVAQVLHQGARLEARLDRVERESRHVAVEILATDRPLAH